MYDVFNHNVLLLNISSIQDNSCVFMPLKLTVEMVSSQGHEDLVFSIYAICIQAVVNSTDKWLKRRSFYVGLLIPISILCWSSAGVYHIHEYLKHV